MRLGLIFSLLMHLSMLAWAIFSIQQTARLPVPETVTISVAVVTPSEVTRMKQGDENTKNLESKAADKPSEQQSQKEAPKPVPPRPKPQAALPPPPPEPEPAKPEPVKPEPPKPEPPKAEPVKPDPPKPDPIAEKLAEPPPPDPGPTPEQLAAEAAKKEAEAKAAAERKRKEAEAKAKAEAERKRKAAEAKAKADAEKRKFDLDKLAKAIDESPEDPRALLDKSNKPTGARPQGDSRTATNSGPSAGTREGRDTVLSARDADLLRGMLNSQLARCWRLPAGGGGGTTVPVVTLAWNLRPDGSLDGEPRVVQSGAGPLSQIATEAAIRAVKTCQPFQLPPDRYANWRQITDWAFDPSKMVQ
ncbi:MAG: cell envelope integrity protein TolA [Hyphomicrobiaceae bacterium]|nr:cell envelope integrity protein TolA [Hyphomicrobiaceae bacterium]